MYLVTGKATEILEEGGTAWRRVGDLPIIGNSLIGSRKGATLGNKVYLIGKMINNLFTSMIFLLNYDI